ncbi:MAG: GNAT family N-acetyltransferase [Ruminococcaceae bacterium]|nr:GNAT family N-acetyltransferase [Oscillospiraceae bacterium]
MYKLRELEREDLKKINKWRNDPDLISCLGAPYRFINEDVDSEWYDKYLNTRGNCVRCAIVDEDKESEVLGLISLVDINYINRSGELHIMIGGSQNRGKGIGTFAVKAMLDHAFDNLNLRRVELGVLETNLPAIKLYEKTGFVKEGIKKESNYKNGRYVSMIMMAILKDDSK